MELILLAAGRGSRVPKKFRDQPKCLVKIKKKTILDHNLNFFKYFKKKTIVVGYKHTKLLPFIKRYKFNYIINKNYRTTNMVYSLFKMKNTTSKEIIICYTDIIFDSKIINIIKKSKNRNYILLKKNWLRVWKGRMEYKKILDDAENVKIKYNKIISIGDKIIKSPPKYQYMGIIKLKSKDFLKLKKFFKKNNNNQIDMTSFLNLALIKKIIKLYPLYTSKFWYEIDNGKDIKFTSKEIW
jgi:choline kinase